MNTLNRNKPFIDSNLFIAIVGIVFLLAWAYYDKMRVVKAFSNPEKLMIVTGTVNAKYHSKKYNTNGYEYSFWIKGARFEGESWIDDSIHRIGSNLYIIYNVDDPTYNKPLTIDEISQRNLRWPIPKKK